MTREEVLKIIKECREKDKRIDLWGVDLRHINLKYIDFSYADLRGADLSYADLRYADLWYANLREVYFLGVDLRGADLRYANLENVKGLVKIMGITQGNIYWKVFGNGLINRGYPFKLGLNELPKGEEFNLDERDLCAYPGFHFASRSWCEVNYPNHPYIGKIRIPEDAQINEPWATNGKASSDKIELLEIYDMKTKENITNRFK